jgi:hypothetical protein
MHTFLISRMILKWVSMTILIAGIGFPISVQAQSSESFLLIVSTLDANVSIDGDASFDLKANEPKKIGVPIGEHYVVAKASQNGQDATLSESIASEAGVQKMLKLDFSKSRGEDVGSLPVATKTEAITVADLNFSISGSLVVGTWLSQNPGKEYPDYPNYYFAFEKGDEILIDFSMSNKNGTNAMVVSTYPGGAVKYSNNAFASLSGLKIKVTERSIYRFSLATNATLDRNGKLTIKRIPASAATADFDPTVTYKTNYVAKTIQSPQEFYVNSGSNAIFKGGKSRVTFPITFPPNTVEWYFSFAAYRDETQVASTKKNINLTGQLAKLLAGGISGGVLSIGISQLTAPPGADYCDIVMLDRNNFSLFEAKEQYRYLTQGTRENFKAGVVQVKCCMDDTYYLGLRNPDGYYGIGVVVEVVAIVAESGWVMANNP